MQRILLVADQAEAFEELARFLSDEGAAQILWAHDSEDGLEQGRCRCTGPCYR